MFFWVKTLGFPKYPHNSESFPQDVLSNRKLKQFGVWQIIMELKQRINAKMRINKSLHIRARVSLKHFAGCKKLFKFEKCYKVSRKLHKIMLGSFGRA